MDDELRDGFPNGLFEFDVLILVPMLLLVLLKLVLLLQLVLLLLSF